MPNGSVIARGLNLRSSLTTGTVLKVLDRRHRVEILGTQTWLRVRTRDGVEGFVLGDYVEQDAGGGAAELPLSPTCVLLRYEHERFVGVPVTADRDFFPLLDRVAGYAEACRLYVHVTSSTRDVGAAVNGAIVKPASRGNHYVGHAIDMNLRAESGAFFNSDKLGKLEQQPRDVQRFIGMIRSDPELRWGGDFRRPDVVHVDDNLSNRFPELWDSKMASRA